MKTFLAIFAMASLLVAAQCNVQPPPPAPAPAPSPAPAPTNTADAAPPPAPAPDPSPSGDRCQDVLTLILSEGCTLPNNWLDACRTARAHGATFHLGCFDLATDCGLVADCLKAAG